MQQIKYASFVCSGTCVLQRAKVKERELTAHAQLLGGRGGWDSLAAGSAVKFSH